MDAKITLSFEEAVIKAAKQYADNNDISLSRLTEYLFRKITESNYLSIEDLPVSDWVTQVAEGNATYKRTSSTRKSMKEEYFKNKK